MKNTGVMPHPRHAQDVDDLFIFFTDSHPTKTVAAALKENFALPECFREAGKNSWQQLINPTKVN